MSNFHVEYLNRDAYLASIATITDTQTLKFAKLSLYWWDERSKWYSKGCVCLCDSDNNHLSYLFFTIDPYRMCLLIHNIFTPLDMRRKGYAFSLLNEIFNIAIERDIKRFKLSSISKSLDFYLSLGFRYWGLNSMGDYYCDLPIPKNGLNTLNEMLRDMDNVTLLGKNMEEIYAKVNGNSRKLNRRQLEIYEDDKIKMGDRYMLHFLMSQKDSQ